MIDLTFLYEHQLGCAWWRGRGDGGPGCPGACDEQGVQTDSSVVCRSPGMGSKRPFGALLPSRAVNVVGRSGAGSFRTTLWIALATTRRVADIAGSRF